MQMPQTRQQKLSLGNDRVINDSAGFSGQETIYTGDDVSPVTINLFRRSPGENRMTASDNNGPRGEEELAANAGLRCPGYLTDRDDTDDDLNLIVMLLMSIVRFPTPVSAGVVN
jgi:hypothetical protein